MKKVTIDLHKWLYGGL